jgi:hypothetical protein
LGFELRVAATFFVSLLWVSALTRSSVADPLNRPRVTLALDPCVLAEPGEVRRSVAVELGADLAGSGEADTTRVIVSCRGAIVVLEVTDPITGKSLSRTVNLEIAPAAARSRLLALAIVELVSASWTELESNPVPAVPPASTPPSPEARAAALESVQVRQAQIAPTATATLTATPPDYRVEGLLELRDFPSPGLASLGFGARLSKRITGPWGWGLDLLTDHGTVTRSAGAISIDTLSTGPSVFL